MRKAIALFAVVGTPAWLLACAEAGPAGNDGLDPFAAVVSHAPACNGVTATIFINSEGFWVKPAGVTVVQLGSGYRIRGTPGDDVIMGSSQDDVILSGGGNDIVCAGAGDDVIEDVAGDDALWGDDGDDHIFAGAGNDRVEGGRGRDVIMGGPGIDELFGDRGADFLWGDTPYRPFQHRDAALGGLGEDHCSADIRVDCES